MKGCDVIVVGAGPAGATLATVLRRDGIAVTLVDGGEPLPALEGYSVRTVERLRQPACPAPRPPCRPPCREPAVGPDVPCPDSSTLLTVLPSIAPCVVTPWRPACP